MSDYIYPCPECGSHDVDVVEPDWERYPNAKSAPSWALCDDCRTDFQVLVVRETAEQEG